jgi:hypothetical protein
MVIPPELGTPELGRHREHHIEVHVGRRWRPIFDEQRLVVVQQVHVIIGGRECVGLLLHPLLLLHRDHRPDGVEVLIPLLFGRLPPQLLHPQPSNPPPLAGDESYRTPMRCRCCFGSDSLQSPLLH